jgi:TP901 family phage tail tape measure protein
MAKLIDIVLRMVDRVSPSTNQIARNASKAGKELETFAAAGKIAASAMGALAATKALDFATDSVREFAAAEDSLRRLETVAKSASGVLGGELTNAFRSAQKFALQHRQSVQEVIDTYFQFGTAGFNLAQSIELGKQALFLANAVMLDTTTSAQLLATVMNSLGQTTSLAFDTVQKSGERAASALATSIQLFAVTGPQLAAGLKFAIGSASLLGVEIEDLVTTLGTLNTAGLKGSVAGTALNQAFIQMDKAVVKLGLDMTKFVNEAGEFSNVADLLAEVQRTVGKTGPFERFNKIIKGFGIRGARAISALLPFAPLLKATQQRMKENGGQAERLSNIYENSLGTAFKRTENAVKVAQQALGKNLAGAAKGLLVVVNRLAKGLSVLVGGLGSWGTVALLTVVGLVGLTAAFYALVQAILVATGATVAFGTVLAAVAWPLAILFGLIAGFVILISVLGGVENQAEAARDKLADMDKVQFKGISDQIKVATNALKTLEKSADDLERKAAKGQLGDLSSTAFGGSVKAAAEAGRRLGVDAKKVQDSFNRALDTTLQADILKGFGLDNIDTAGLDQVLNFIATTKAAGELEAKVVAIADGFLGIGGNVSVVVGDVEEFRAVITKLNDEFGEGILDNNKAIVDFAKLLGVSGEEARKVAESIDKLADFSIDDDFLDFESTSFIETVEAFKKLPLLARALDLERALGPADRFQAALGTALVELTAIAGLDQRLSTLGGHLETIQKAGLEGEDVNIGENMAQQIEILGNSVKLLDTQKEIIEQSIKDLAAVQVDELFEKLPKAAQEGIRTLLANAKDALQTNILGAQELRKTEESLASALKKGLAPIGGTFLKDIVANGMAAGLVDGTNAGLQATAEALRSEIHEAIIRGATSGFTTIGSAQLQPFLNQVQKASGEFFQAIQSGDPLQGAAAQFREAIGQGPNLGNLTKLIEGSQVLEGIVNQSLQLGPALSGAFQEMLNPINEAAEKVAGLRASLLGVKAGPDQAVINQLINLQRGQGAFGGLDLGTATLDQKISELEGIFRSVQGRGGDFAVSSNTLSALRTAYQALIKEQEESRKRADLTDPLSKSREAISQTQEGLGGMGTHLKELKADANLLKQTFEEMPGALEDATAAITKFKAEVLSIQGGTGIGVDQNGSTLNIQIGDFNISVDASGEGGLSEEDVEAAIQAVRTKLEEADAAILEKLAQILSNK